MVNIFNKIIIKQWTLRVKVIEYDVLEILVVSVDTIN